MWWKLNHFYNEKFILASSNVEDGAQLDIATNGYWGGRSEKIMLMLKILTQVIVLPALEHSIESTSCARKCSYEPRIHEVEQNSFTPLIFLAIGGIAKEATLFCKCLASLLSDKWDSNYAAVMG